MIEGPLVLPAALWDRLVAAHAIPPRHYHSFAHVQQVAHTFRQVPGWSQPREVFIAILFHDAVYEAGRPDNESRSAAMATSAIEAWSLDVDAARVAYLSGLTARHGRIQPGEVDDDAALFLDCDMAILGSDPASYDTYEVGIAAEYRPVFGDAYTAGRQAFLQRLLTRPIYLSTWFRDRYEEAARGNLMRSLSGIGQ